MALPVLGRVLELAPVRAPGVPDERGREWRQLLRSGDVLPGRPALGENDVTGFEEIVTASTHYGCHLDAPGRRPAPGRAAGELFGDDGLRELGAEELHPVLTRGVLFGDAAVEAGDVVLFRGGITPEQAHEAHAGGAALLGLDVPACDLDLPLPVISNLVLDELAAVATGPFLFAMAPIRGAGSTGAPVSPLAIL